MKKDVIVCGVIGGLITTIWMFAGLNGNLIDQMDNNMSMVIGYASMILAFSLIFVAVKNYRDKYNNGVISFGKAFKIGLYITLITSTIYVLAWQIDYFFFIPDFFDHYVNKEIVSMQAKGVSEQAIQAHRTEMEEMGRMYKNPLFNAMVTYMEILPVGLLVSLIAAAILKRKANPVAV